MNVLATRAVWLCLFRQFRIIYTGPAASSTTVSSGGRAGPSHWSCKKINETGRAWFSQHWRISPFASRISISRKCRLVLFVDYVGPPAYIGLFHSTSRSQQAPSLSQ